MKHLALIKKNNDISNPRFIVRRLFFCSIDCCFTQFATQPDIRHRIKVTCTAWLAQFQFLSEKSDSYQL